MVLYSLCLLAVVFQCNLWSCQTAFTRTRESWAHWKPCSRKWRWRERKYLQVPPPRPPGLLMTTSLYRKTSSCPLGTAFTEPLYLQQASQCSSKGWPTGQEGKEGWQRATRASSSKTRERAQMPCPSIWRNRTGTHCCSPSEEVPFALPHPKVKEGTIPRMHQLPSTATSSFPPLLSKAYSQAGEGHEFVTETAGAGILLHVNSGALLPLFLLTTPSSDSSAPEIGKHL